LVPDIERRALLFVFLAVQFLYMELIHRFLSEEQGQDLIEYTLLMAFIALASASIFVSAGNSVNTIWQAGSNQLSNAAVSAS
jgi:Flp pilus assembly pilin Flp